MGIKRGHYLGNPNLKAAGVSIQYTKEQMTQYIRCAQDPIYFMDNYIKIIHVDKGLVPFKPYPYQEKLISSIHHNRFTICKLPRQSGKSTTILSYILHYILFNTNVSVGILANKQAIANELLYKAQISYEGLPFWMQQGIISWNKQSIELENGSRIISSATSSSAVRGGTYNFLLLDEFAHIPDSVASEFFNSVYPTISSGNTTKVCIISTPKGMNMFYKLWTEATEGENSYVPVEANWWDVPGRDEKWKAETIKNTSQSQFEQEFGCEFIGSINTLISSSKLKCMAFVKPKETIENLDVYEKPQKGHSYVLVVDVARGSGLDYSAFTIIDVTESPFKLVAKYRDANIAPILFPHVIYNAARWFNNANVLVEINDIGGQVADILHYDLEYDYLLSTAQKGRAGQVIGEGFGSDLQLGVRTTKSVKQIGCSTLKSLIETDRLLIQDYDTISELTTFTLKGNSYVADEGKNDDLVMTLVLFAWLTAQKYFKDLTDHDIREQMFQKEINHYYDQLCDFRISDGMDDEIPEKMGGDLWYKAKPQTEQPQEGRKMNTLGGGWY